MKKILTLLIAALLFYCLVSGVVMNIIMITTSINHSLALTSQLMWALYLTAVAVVVGLLWLFIRVGSHV